VQKNFCFPQAFEDFPKDQLILKLCVRIHGVPIKIFTQNQSKLDQLQTELPLAWQLKSDANSSTEKFAPELLAAEKFVEIFWHSPESWYERSVPECEIEFHNEVEYAIQRDFAGQLTLSEQGSPQILLLCPFENEDGFFNALRWILPRYLLSSSQALLHSSCVIGRDGLAYFFLGPSGAGKTTVTRLRGDRDVLGDDMNVLTLNHEGVFAQLGYFGQAIQSPLSLGVRIPVGGIFFLKQSEQNFLKNISKGEAARRFAASCANLFWQETGKSLAPAVLSLTSDVLNRIPFWELNFNLTGGFWHYVDGETQAIDRSTLAESWN